LLFRNLISWIRLFKFVWKNDKSYKPIKYRMITAISFSYLFLLFMHWEQQIQKRDKYLVLCLGKQTIGVLF